MSINASATAEQVLDHFDELEERGPVRYRLDRFAGRAIGHCDFCWQPETDLVVDVEHLPGVCTCHVDERPNDDEPCVERTYSQCCRSCWETGDRTLTSPRETR